MSPRTNLIPPTEAAKQLDVKPGTLATWRYTGRTDLPFIKVGRKVMYRQSDIDAYLERNTYQHTGQEVQA